LKGFSAAGAFHFAGWTLNFDDWAFALDGNKAVGLLALTATGSRPRVEGTLAFDRLVLNPYLGKTAQTESKQALRAGATTASRHSINSMPIAISVPTAFGVNP
jgi:hypothetical protein